MGVMDQGVFSVLVTVLGVVVPLGGLLWRISASTNKRIDAMNRRMDAIAAELRAEISQGQESLRAETLRGQESLRAETLRGQESLRAEMLQGQESLRAEMKALTAAVSGLDNRLSRVEGMLAPKPWEPMDTPAGRGA